MQNLVEEFLQYLRHERGQSEHTQKTYAALLGKFVAWANAQQLTSWDAVQLRHLTAFLLHERERNVEPPGSNGDSSTSMNPKKLSSESVYLEIASLRAFYRFAVNEKHLNVNFAENLSLPRRWKRLPKSLSNEEIGRLLTQQGAETPA